ncbi:MAG: hypothetical protein OXE87_15635 [Chloroflexi bacterium]|nr:hypothetical protein [Chloroflexota bacterium]
MAVYPSDINTAAQVDAQNFSVGHDGMLSRHPLSRLSGEITESERDYIANELCRSGVPVEVDLLDGQVVYDWHRYQVALQLGKLVVHNQLDSPDPPGYLISRLLSVRALDRGQCAAIEVTLRWWHPTGRPKKPAQDAGLVCYQFPAMTTRSMAEEAGVSETYIRMAKRVYRKGGEGAIREVVLGELSLRAADIMLSGVGRREGVATIGVDVDGEQSTTWPTRDDQPPDAPHGSSVGEDASEITASSWVGMVMMLTGENRRLKRDNRELRSENRLTDARVVRLSNPRAQTRRPVP